MQLDIGSIGSSNLITLLSQFNTVLHTAGLFKVFCNGVATLEAEAAIKSGAFYVDVLDALGCFFDIASLSCQAENAGMIYITSHGIY